MNTRKLSQIGGLVLTRKVGERVSINHGEIMIEVVAMNGKEVRLAIKGPEHIPIFRAEVEKDEDAQAKFRLDK